MHQLPDMGSRSQCLPLHLAGLSGSSFPFSAFLSGAVLTAVPGIVAQLILIPLIVAALQKAKLTA